MTPFHLVLAIVLLFTAYFVKGFTGFGPALILIPTFSLIFNPREAVMLTTVFDFVAGFILLFSVRHQVDWKTVVLVLLAFFPGAYFGARLITVLPVSVFKKVLALFVLFFIVLIFWQSTRSKGTYRFGHAPYWRFLFSFFAGLGGGLVGISGPLLVIFFKLSFPKPVFRTQLIAVFAFGAAWRLFLYHSLGLHLSLTTTQWILFLLALLSAVTAGSLVQIRINEQKFNRIVALILLIPCVTLLL